MADLRYGGPVPRILPRLGPVVTVGGVPVKCGAFIGRCNKVPSQSFQSKNLVNFLQILEQLDATGSGMPCLPILLSSVCPSSPLSALPSVSTPSLPSVSRPSPCLDTVTKYKRMLQNYKIYSPQSVLTLLNNSAFQRE